MLRSHSTFVAATLALGAVGAPRIADAVPAASPAPCTAITCASDCPSGQCPDLFALGGGRIEAIEPLLPGAEHRYVFSVGAPATVVADTDDGRDCMPGDTVLRLERWDAARNARITLAMNDDIGGGSRCSSISADLLPGDYALVVTGYQGQGVDPYRLAVDLRTPSSRGGPIAERIDAGGRDVFEFAVPGGRYDISATARDCRSLDQDLTLEVFDAAGSPVAFNDDRAPGVWCPALSVQLPRGRYRALVKGYDGADAADFDFAVGPGIDVHQSLMVHDDPTLVAFGLTLSDVLHLVDPQPNAPAGTHPLFTELWAQQAPLPPGSSPIRLNDFPYPARAEHLLRRDDLSAYRLIAAVNRLDLADERALTCGEQRLVFAREDQSERALIIFEAVMPNPQPGCSAACQPLAEAWAELSALDRTDPNDRQIIADRLRTIFVDGLARGGRQYRPAVHPDHFGMNVGGGGYLVPGGQIRTNQFAHVDEEMGEQDWTLREFHLARTNIGMRLRRAPVAGSPASELFDGGFNDPRRSDLEDALSDQIATLADAHPGRAVLTDEGAFRDAESLVDGQRFYDVSQGRLDGDLERDLRAALTTDRIPAPITPLSGRQIIDRVQASSCAGCHQPSDFALDLPDALGPAMTVAPSAGFVHISEILQGDVFPISPALTDEMLPARAEKLADRVAGPTQCGPTLAPDVLEPLEPVELAHPLVLEPIDLTGAFELAAGDPQMAELLMDAIIDAELSVEVPRLEDGSPRPVH